MVWWVGGGGHNWQFIMAGQLIRRWVRGLLCMKALTFSYTYPHSKDNADPSLMEGRGQHEGCSRQWKNSNRCLSGSVCVSAVGSWVRGYLGTGPLLCVRQWCKFTLCTHQSYISWRWVLQRWPVLHLICIWSSLSHTYIVWPLNNFAIPFSHVYVQLLYRHHSIKCTYRIKE